MTTTVSRAGSMHALAEANRVRFARVALHQVIAAMSSKGGAAHVSRMLEERPEYLVRLSLRQFLTWIDRWGDLRVERVLAKLEIGQRHDVTVGELTDRQVALLVEALTGVRR